MIQGLSSLAFITNMLQTERFHLSVKPTQGQIARQMSPCCLTTSFKEQMLFVSVTSTITLGYLSYPQRNRSLRERQEIVVILISKCHEPMSDGYKSQIQFYFQYIRHLKWRVALKVHSLRVRPASLGRRAGTAGAGNVNKLSCEAGLKMNPRGADDSS